MKNKHKQDFGRKIVTYEVTMGIQSFNSKIRLKRFLSWRRLRQLDLHL